MQTTTANGISTALTDVDNNPMKRGVYLVAGHVLLGIGFVGMALPVLPTTIFWIGAAACYARSSPRLYEKLIGRGRTGKAIEAYRNHGVIATSGKVAAGIGMAVAAVIILLTPIDIYFKVVGWIGLGIGAAYVFTRPSRPALDPPN